MPTITVTTTVLTDGQPTAIATTTHDTDSPHLWPTHLNSHGEHLTKYAGRFIASLTSPKAKPSRSKPSDPSLKNHVPATPAPPPLTPIPVDVIGCNPKRCKGGKSVCRRGRGMKK